MRTLRSLERTMGCHRRHQQLRRRRRRHPILNPDTAMEAGEGESSEDREGIFRKEFPKRS